MALVTHHPPVPRYRTSSNLTSLPVQPRHDFCCKQTGQIPSSVKILLYIRVPGDIRKCMYFLTYRLSTRLLQYSCYTRHIHLAALVHRYSSTSRLHCLFEWLTISKTIHMHNLQYVCSQYMLLGKDLTYPDAGWQIPHCISAPILKGARTSKAAARPNQSCAAQHRFRNVKTRGIL